MPVGPVRVVKEQIPHALTGKRANGKRTNLDSPSPTLNYWIPQNQRARPTALTR